MKMGNKKRCDCESCVNFTPIGEGDHICCEHPDILLMDEYARTKDYLYCKGKDYECRQLMLRGPAAGQMVS